MKRRSYAILTSVLAASALVLSLSGCSNKYIGSSDPGAGNVKAASAAADYASRLFDTSYVHTIDIAISGEDWSDLKANPLEKTKYKVNITIDGETIDSVSFATKGNTSLSSIASDSESDRYSFKVNFGKYNKGQTYYGLDKLNLNNIYADATYMKDYLSYELFREAGVDAPLVSYVWLTINGEDHGLYIAIEDISDGYLDRADNGEGELYKPESEMLANMGKPGNMQMPNGKDGEMPSMPKDGSFPEGMTPPKDGERPEKPQGGGDGMPGGFGGFGGFGSSSSGADLKYIDDEISSYSDIFDNAETDADDEAKQRVIAALKGLSEGKDLEKYLDTDEIIRYFAAHNFVLNYDSYTGNMLHNYYLYENDGKLSMLPWDYNLAFGGFSGNQDATSLVNKGIETPLSGTTDDARPMWGWILKDENYLKTYKSVYDSLISGYFESGKFESEIDALYKMLYPYIEKDPSAFYTADEFTKAYENLKQFCLLRAKSIRLQLDGELSTKDDEQDASKKVDASSIDISSMGSQGGGPSDRKSFPGQKNGA